MLKVLRSLVFVSFVAITPVHLPVYAQDSSAKAPIDDAKAQALKNAESESQAALLAANAAMRPGPVDIKFTDQAVIKVPKGFVFVPVTESARLLRSMGNSPRDDLLGMVFPANDVSGNWFIVARFEKSGYIKDDDAKDWNADELLANLKEGTEAGNKERLERGIPAMEVVGWVELPHYNATTQRMIWSASTRDKGAPTDAQKGINYNTYALGREGYISMNLVTNLNEVEVQKPIARQLLGALTFNDGKRYADFNSSTDKMAEYGLAALIGGIAAKKLGLLAVGAAFLAKFAKIIALAALGAGAGFAKFFKRDRS